MRLTFGVFVQVLRLCKKKGVSDTRLVGAMTRLVDPKCGYADKNNKDTVSAIIRCERNLSPGNIEEMSVGTVRKPAESLSNVVEGAANADLDMISDLFAMKVINLLDENKKLNCLLALLDIIKNDETLDDDSFGGMKLNFEKYTETTKKALLSQSTYFLAEFLAGIFLYTAAFGLQNIEGKDTFVLITLEYVRGQKGDGLLQVFDSRMSRKSITPALSAEQLNRRVTPQLCPAFTQYLSRIHTNNNKIKTLFYNEHPQDFYSFYVCNDISKRHFPSFLDEFPVEFDMLMANDRRDSRNTIRDVDIHKLSEISKFTIITGTGGLGKSMMMRHLLLSTINNYENFPLVPVLVLLKDYDGKITDLFEFTYSIICGIDSSITKADYKNALETGSCLILLDGLDEIGSQLGFTFEKELHKFTLAYPDNHFIISSRAFQNFVSYNAFTVLRMMPFNKEQALRLIDKLDYRPDNPTIKQKFRKALNETLYKTHPSFIQNPLLLTIMLMTFARYAEVPSKMHVFYKDAYDALASVHDASKGAYKRSFKTKLTPDEFSDYLAEICFRTYREEKYEFTKEEFNQIFEKLTLDTKNINPDDFLYDLCYCLCLMYAEGDKYYFQHRSFQEYFSALFLSRQKDEFIKRLGSFFEKHARAMRTDQTFDMLRDMIPDKINSFIIIPYLQNFAATYSGEDGYRRFLCDMYPRIHFSEGVDSKLMSNYVRKPTEYLFAIVVLDMMTIGLINGKNYSKYAGLPTHENFNAETFVKVPSKRKGNRHTDIVPLEYIQESDPSVDPSQYEIVGRAYVYDMNKIFHDPEKYAELIAAFEDDKFIHKIEFLKAFEYLDKLLKKQKSKEDSLFDLL